jgi:crotonobetainyl-CoA:carnitine CoA-transferase CaiB-like acyl-CoA transferase
MSARAPLAGVRVLDFGHILAGPYCARLLADLGADVVKVESRSRAEGMGRSHLGAGYKGRRDRSPHMLMTNRNKRSVTLNLKTPSGVETATRLAAAADVLVENYSAGAMDRLGLGYERLRPKNPRLIYLSLSGYGHHGPRRDWTSMNLNLQAYSGLMMATGEEGDPPTTIAASWNDYLGALHGCVAVMNALVERKRTGLGVNLDLSQFECSVSSVGPLLLASAASGCPPPRLGNRAEKASPQGVYRCFGADEWCAISVRTEDQWRALASTIGINNARYDSLAGRLEYQDELDRIVEGWTRERPALKVEALLQAAGVPAERMRRTRDLLDDPASRDLYAPVEPPGHSQLMAKLPFRFGASRAAEPGRAPLIGEHTADVLADWLGLDGAEVERLEAEGALE